MKPENIPENIGAISESLEKAGFEAYLVGGCVRDVLAGRKPKDWDFTTNARPEDIIKIFPKTFYENEYGTVGVVNENTEDESLKVVEITPYRIEGKYSDYRRPDSVVFSKNLEDDLKRRDFTINAIAYDITKGQIVDPYNGQKDIKDKVIRAVGDPEERFAEDALRVLRAIRLATELGFMINSETEKALENNVKNLGKIAQERIRDEFIKLIMSPDPMIGIVLANRLGILKYVSPETEAGINIKQNGDHIYDVWEHNLRALQHSADREWPLHVRLSALLHDVGKPKSRRFSPEINDNTFYGHEVVGERMAKKILTDLKYPNQLIEIVVKLVRRHMFFSDPDQISMSAVRRIIANVGEDLVWDLMKLRACDRIGMGRPKEDPYRLRKYEAMIEEAMRAPTSVKMLKINGNDLMTVLHEKPGPKIGFILNALLEEVLKSQTPKWVNYIILAASVLAAISGIWALLHNYNLI